MNYVIGVMTPTNAQRQFVALSDGIKQQAGSVASRVPFRASRDNFAEAHITGASREGKE